MAAKRKNDNMQEKIKNLEIGESINVTGPIPKIRQYCSRLEHKYSVVKIADERCLVVRIESDTVGLRERVIDAINQLEPFDEYRVLGNTPYIRTIVSQYNKKHNRNIVVSKYGDGVMLTEDIMTRATITTDEFNTFKTVLQTRLDLLRERIVDVMDEEII